MLPDVPDGRPAGLARPARRASSGRGTTPGRSARTRTRPDFRVDSLALPVGFSVERLERRQALLDEIERASATALARAAAGERPDGRAARAGLCRCCSRARSRGPSTSSAEDPKAPRPLRPAHVRPVAPAGPAAGRGGRADRPGEHGPGPDLGHALGQLQDRSRTGSCRRPTGASRPCSTTSQAAACSTRRWWS